MWQTKTTFQCDLKMFSQHNKTKGKGVKFKENSPSVLKNSFHLDKKCSFHSFLLWIGDLVVRVETVETAIAFPDSAELWRHRRRNLWRRRRCRSFQDALRPLTSGRRLELLARTRFLLDRFSRMRRVGSAGNHRIS